MGPEDTTMGQRIMHQLEVKNLSQAAFARLLHVSRATVGQWCHGVSEPRPRHLLAIAELLFDGDVHYLVHGPAREPEGGFPSAPRPVSTGSSGIFVSPMRRRRKT